MTKELTHALQIKTKSGFIFMSSDDVLNFMEEMYDSHPLIKKVYEDIKWTGQYIKEELKAIKQMIIAEYNGI